MGNLYFCFIRNGSLNSWPFLRIYLTCQPTYPHLLRAHFNGLGLCGESLFACFAPRSEMRSISSRGIQLRLFPFIEFWDNKGILDFQNIPRGEAFLKPWKCFICWDGMGSGRMGRSSKLSFHFFSFGDKINTILDTYFKFLLGFKIWSTWGVATTIFKINLLETIFQKWLLTSRF